MSPGLAKPLLERLLESPGPVRIDPYRDSGVMGLLGDDAIY